MRNNLGTTDKTIRIIIALAILVFVFDKTISAPVSLFFFLLSMVLIGTCLKGNCFVYRFFKINTNKNLNDKARIYERNQTLLNNYFKNYRERYSGIKKDF